MGIPEHEGKYEKGVYTRIIRSNSTYAGMLKNRLHQVYLGEGGIHVLLIILAPGQLKKGIKFNY